MPYRTTGPLRWTKARFVRSLLTTDTGFAEVMVGVWVIAMRGMMLIELGFVSARAEGLLNMIHVNSDKLGAALVLVGILQTVAVGLVGWLAQPIRAWMAFTGSILCLLGYLAYVGIDMSHTSMAWLWLSLMLCEQALCWRLWLVQIVAQDGAKK